MFSGRVAHLRTSLAQPEYRTEAAAIIATLIRAVTILKTEGARSAEAEIEASTTALVAFATKVENPRRSRGGGSTKVVAGTGFEPVTFRL